jgi:hypothetical protein
LQRNLKHREKRRERVGSQRLYNFENEAHEVVTLEKCLGVENPASEVPKIDAREAVDSSSVTTNTVVSY